MTSKDTDSKSAFTKLIYRFLGGAALGGFVVAIPILYGSSSNLGLLQVSLASALIVACGLLSSAWGEKFIDIVMRTLEGTGF